MVCPVAHMAPVSKGREVCNHTCIVIHNLGSPSPPRIIRMALNRGFPQVLFTLVSELRGYVGRNIRFQRTDESLPDIPSLPGNDHSVCVGTSSLQANSSYPNPDITNESKPLWHRISTCHASMKREYWYPLCSSGQPVVDIKVVSLMNTVMQ